MKKSKEEYNNFFISFYNNENENLADLAWDSISKNDYILVKGKINILKKETPDSEYPDEKLVFTAKEFNHVTFDENKQGFVIVDN